VVRSSYDCWIGLIAKEKDAHELGAPVVSILIGHKALGAEIALEIPGVSVTSKQFLKNFAAMLGQSFKNRKERRARIEPFDGIANFQNAKLRYRDHKFLQPNLNLLHKEDPEGHLQILYELKILPRFCPRVNSGVQSTF
jgi:hypothetical protein